MMAVFAAEVGADVAMRTAAATKANLALLAVVEFRRQAGQRVNAVVVGDATKEMRPTRMQDCPAESDRPVVSSAARRFGAHQAGSGSLC